MHLLWPNSRFWPQVPSQAWECWLCPAATMEGGPSLPLNLDAGGLPAQASSSVRTFPDSPTQGNTSGPRGRGQETPLGTRSGNMAQEGRTLLQFPPQGCCGEEQKPSCRAATMLAHPASLPSSDFHGDPSPLLFSRLELSVSLTLPVSLDGHLPEWANQGSHASGGRDRSREGCRLWRWLRGWGPGPTTYSQCDLG